MIKQNYCSNWNAQYYRKIQDIFPSITWVRGGPNYTNCTNILFLLYFILMSIIVKLNFEMVKIFIRMYAHLLKLSMTFQYSNIWGFTYKAGHKIWDSQFLELHHKMHIYLPKSVHGARLLKQLVHACCTNLPLRQLWRGKAELLIIRTTNDLLFAIRVDCTYLI